MKKVICAVVVTMAISLLAINAQAERIWCEGVPNVSMNIEWGILYADIGYGTWDLCSIQTTRYNIKPEVCEAMYKALLLAEAKGKKVKFTFDANNNETCGDVGNWGEPSLFPYHMNFLK